MRRAYKYRLYPNRKQERALTTMVETHRHLYNRALAERKNAYEQEKRSVTYEQQSASLKEQRETNSYLRQTNFSSCQATLKRLQRAFENFFRRVQAGEKEPGYPRFKGKYRFDTVVFPSYGDGCKLKEGRLYIQHIGLLKVKWYRPLEGRIKTISLKWEADGWYVCFSCEVEDKEILPSSSPAIGIDLGLKAFLMTNEGEEIKPPKYYRKAQKALRRAQRKLCLRKKGSKRRGKAGRLLKKQHQHIANQRRNFHHQVAHSLVKRYGLVAHENLNVAGIAQTRLAKSTYDVGWGSFLSILHSKAEEAGCTVIAVPPDNTTQRCGSCGKLPEVKKTLADRIHICPFCGYTADRDVNAAQNILNLGLDGAFVAQAPRKESAAARSRLL
jgi:putative transposase